MTKTLLIALSLLASVAWLQAQSQYPQTGSSQTGATASGQTTVRGCLQGSNGNYTLTTESGTVYQLQGDTAKLSEHIGHEVAITDRQQRLRMLQVAPPEQRRGAHSNKPR